MGQNEVVESTLTVERVIDPIHHSIYLFLHGESPFYKSEYEFSRSY